MGEHPINANWAATFLDLQTARTVEELRAVLLGWHGIRGSSVWEEPYMLFMRFHRDEPLDAEVTTALLCTDYRWRHASHHLIERIDASGVLGREQLEALADWFVGEAFEIEIEGERSRQRGTTAKTTLRRPIWPPLRRWAARQLVRLEPERWRDLIDTASTLPSRDASAVVAGVMDAAEHLPVSDLSAVASIGIGHGSGTVRLAALPVIAMTAGVDAAMAAVRSDSSAKVRAWRPPRVPEAIGTDDTDGSPASTPDRRPRRCSCGKADAHGTGRHTRPNCDGVRPPADRVVPGEADGRDACCVTVGAAGPDQSTKWQHNSPHPPPTVTHGRGVMTTPGMMLEQA